MMTINIQLRVTHDSAEKDAVILKLVRVMAKQILTQAMLIKDDHEPHLEITAGDFFSADRELLLYDDQGNELDSEVTDVMERYQQQAGLHRIDLNVPKKPDEN